MKYQELSYMHLLVSNLSAQQQQYAPLPDHLLHQQVHDLLHLVHGGLCGRLCGVGASLLLSDHNP